MAIIDRSTHSASVKTVGIGGSDGGSSDFLDRVVPERNPFFIASVRVRNGIETVKKKLMVRVCGMVRASRREVGGCHVPEGRGAWIVVAMLDDPVHPWDQADRSRSCDPKRTVLYVRGGRRMSAVTCAMVLAACS